MEDPPASPELVVGENDSTLAMQMKQLADPLVSAKAAGSEKQTQHGRSRNTSPISRYAITIFFALTKRSELSGDIETFSIVFDLNIASFAIL